MGVGGWGVSAGDQWLGGGGRAFGGGRGRMTGAEEVVGRHTRTHGLYGAAAVSGIWATLMQRSYSAFRVRISENRPSLSHPVQKK